MPKSESLCNLNSYLIYSLLFLSYWWQISLCFTLKPTIRTLQKTALIFYYGLFLMIYWKLKMFPCKAGITLELPRFFLVIIDIHVYSYLRVNAHTLFLFENTRLCVCWRRELHSCGRTDFKRWPSVMMLEWTAV